MSWISTFTCGIYSMEYFPYFYWSTECEYFCFLCKQGDWDILYVSRKQTRKFQQWKWLKMGEMDAWVEAAKLLMSREDVSESQGVLKTYFPSFAEDVEHYVKWHSAGRQLTWVTEVQRGNQRAERRRVSHRWKQTPHCPTATPLIGRALLPVSCVEKYW